MTEIPDEVVEAVARAIHVADCGCPDDGLQPDDEGYYLKLGEAALSAPEVEAFFRAKIALELTTELGRKDGSGEDFMNGIEFARDLIVRTLL